MLSRNKPSQSGVILISTLFALSLMSVLLIGLVMILLTELQIAKNDRDGKVALAAAKAGVEASINALQSNGSWAAGFSNQAGPSGSGYSYTVTVQNAYPFVVLTSVGQPGGALSKTVRATCMVAGSPNTAPYRVRLDKWEEL